MLYISTAKAAANAITAYHAVAYTANSNEATATTVIGAAAAGIAQNTVAAGSHVDVIQNGYSKVILGGTVAPGDNLALSSTAGVLSKATTGQTVIGIAQQKGASGDVILAFIIPGGKAAA